MSRARWSVPGLGVVVGGEWCWWAGPAPYPWLWGEAVRCLGIHPLHTRREAGGVRGALRPQRFRLGSITCSTRTRWGHADRRARIRRLCPNRSRRHFVEAADRSVTQPVEDQRQESAGCSNARDLVPSRLSEPPVGFADRRAALVARNGFDRCPPHQGEALFREAATHTDRTLGWSRVGSSV